MAHGKTALGFNIFVVAAMVFAAFAWGANEPWAMGLISMVALSVAGVWLISRTWQKELQLRFSWFYVPVFLLLVVSAAGIISPASVEPYSTSVYLLVALSCFAVIFLLHNESGSRSNAKILVISVIALGSFEALYGLVQYLGDYNYIWQFKRETYTAIATGTLINRNHYALLVNLCICTGIGYLYYRSSRMLHGGQLSWRRILAAPGAAKLAWIVFWIAIMGLGVIFSMSRMGIAAMIIGAGVMIIAANRAESGKKATAVGLLILISVLGLATYIGIDAVLARYENLSIERESDRNRIALWRDAWTMIKEHPWFGQGLGTFQWTYPAYESVQPDVPAKYAHNDYLQALAEVGLVGLGLLLWAFAAVWRVAVKNLRDPKDPLVRGIGLGTIGALTVIALQEITDFGLYIPGVAMTAAVMIGLNLRAQTMREDDLATNLHESARM